MLIGLAIIWKSLSRPTAEAPPSCSPDPQAGPIGVLLRQEDPRTGPSDVVKEVAVLAGNKRTVNSQHFRGGTLTAFMGGCEIDLREASISSSPRLSDESDIAVQLLAALFSGLLSSGAGRVPSPLRTKGRQEPELHGLVLV